MTEHEEGYTRAGWKDMAATLTRSLLGVVALVTAYFVAPSGVDTASWPSGVAAVVALAVFGWVFVRQVRRVKSARFPVLRAVEALALVGTLFVVGVSATHFTYASAHPQAYSEALDRMDALYFTVTVLATVGFGDITPVSTTARAMVTVQMVVGVALLGAGVRLLFEVAKQAAQARGNRLDLTSDERPQGR